MAMDDESSMLIEEEEQSYETQETQCLVEVQSFVKQFANPLFKGVYQVSELLKYQEIQQDKLFDVLMQLLSDLNFIEANSENAKDHIMHYFDEQTVDENLELIDKTYSQFLQGV